MPVVQNAIQRAAVNSAAPAAQGKAAASVSEMISSLVDREGYRKRFDELLGKRAPQFVSSIITLVNATPELRRALVEAPETIIQSALKAAAFDLPIDPSLGYAYIVPFNNSKKLDNGQYQKRAEAAFVLGYKGMNQLALRTGVYRTINVVDVREGELKSYNRLTEEVVIDFVEDEDEREKLPIVGWCGYYRLVNGTEKTVYMTRKQIEKHEQNNRKGQYMTKGWREDFDAMAAKTVFRRLIGKWGLMSIDYQTRPDPAALAAVTALAAGAPDDLEPGAYEVVEDTGEVVAVGSVGDDTDDAALPAAGPDRAAGGKA